MNTLRPFHLAWPVNDLEKCRVFYRETLNCKEGRSSDQWVDFNFFGHQLVLHQKPQEEEAKKIIRNKVDGQGVPVPHFGVVLDYEEWIDFSNRLKQLEIEFEIAPCIRFEGEAGEQATMFFTDPEGNALEFKAFKDPGQLFEK